MLPEMIFRLRGGNTWQEAIASVFSSEVWADGGKQGPPRAKITFVYKDPSGDYQSGSFVADSFTSSYNLRPGDTFPVRFDPKRTSVYYVAGLSTWFTKMNLAIWIMLIVCVALAVLISIFRQ